MQKDPGHDEDMKRTRNYLEDDLAEGHHAKRVKESLPLGSRELCQYGINCYRRSCSHFKEFRHIELETLFMSLMEQGPLPLPLLSLDPGNKFPNPETTRVQLQLLLEADLLDIIQREKEECVVTLPKECELEVTDAIAGPSRIADNCFSKDTNKVALESEKAFVKPTSNSLTSESNLNTRRLTPLVKWELSCPFNFFLTRIPGEENVPYSMSFRELFDPSFGDVHSVFHFNFMVEPEWYIDTTQNTTLDGKETTIVYGVESPELEECSRIFPWLTCHLVKSPFPFGHHHTKMSLLQYSDGSMRFLIYTANLIESDWASRTQGLWMSPKCPKSEAGDTSSVSGSLFKAHIIEYLSTYHSKCRLSELINVIRKINTSEIKVVFVGSVPITSQSGQNGFQWGVKKMETTLKRFQPPTEMDSTWPLFMQCSSIGSLGPSDDWLHSEFGRHLGTPSTSYKPSTPIKLIYPSDRNVRQSVDGIYGGSCLPYSRTTHSKQTWLKKAMHVWKSNFLERTRIMPHIKTYGRISSDEKKLAWFLLTSANLSKAAWGKLNKNHDKLCIMSWEVGVLFIPQLFGFPTAFDISTHQESKNGTFLLPFDIPLVKYDGSDEPWNIETLRDAK